MRQLGWEVWGIEVDPAAAVRARARTGNAACVFAGMVEEAEYPQLSFDLVTLSHVLEHLHDPLRVLRMIRGWLAPDAQLRIRVPNIESRESRIFGRSQSGLDVPRHLFHFSPSSITRLLDIAGFEIAGWRTQFQGSALGDSVKQLFLRRAGHESTVPTGGMLHRVSVPLGWLTCALGNSAYFAIMAVARDRGQVPSGREATQ